MCVCVCELGAVSAASMSRRGSSDDGDFVSLAATSGFASIITCSFLSLSLCLALHSKNNNKKNIVDQLMLLFVVNVVVVTQ